MPGGASLDAEVPRGAGIGGVRALTLMQKHGTLEKVLASLDPSKYDIPDPFPFDEARRMFKGVRPPASSACPRYVRPSATLLCGCRKGPCYAW